MLKKNLLLMGRKKEQRKVKLTIEENETSTGYNYGYVKDYIGSLDVLPYWGSKVTVIRVFQCRQNQDTHFYLTDRSVPKVTAHVKGYSKTITTNVEELGDIYSMYSSNGDVRYLTFDPPPRRLLGSKDTQTDLKYYLRKYYVEGEDPWEAQDAEQGNASYLCTRNRSKDHSRGISQRWRSRGCANVLQLYGLRSDSHCPIASPSSQRENSDVLHYPSKEYRGVVHWRNKRFRGHNSDSFGCRNSDRHVSRCPSTYSGQLHNQWIRVHVLNEKEALYA